MKKRTRHDFDKSEENILDLPEDISGKRRKGKRKVIILAICMTVVLAIAIGITLLVLSRPQNTIKYAAYSTAKDIFSNEAVELMTETLYGGSIEVSAKTDAIALAGKVYLDLERVQVQAENVSFLALESGTGATSSFSASCALGLDSIWLKVNDEAYGIRSGNAEENFLSSKILSKESELYRPLQALCILYDDPDAEELLKELEKELQAYNEKRLELYLEYAEITDKKETVKLADGREKCRVITLFIDDNAVDDVNEELLEYLESREALLDLMYEYEDFFVALFGGDPQTDDIDDLFEDYLEEQKKRSIPLVI